MSLHQYIGARYVPLFYKNSLDPSSCEWEPNVTYESLTIVTLPNDHCYISKKTVPDTVGTPASNADYWLETGNFNAYIQDLQDQIDDINEEIEPVTKPFLIWIGDSFSESGRSDLVDVVCSKNGYEYINECQGGTGFAQTYYSYRTFDVQLADAVSHMTDDQKKRVKKIIVYGGVNDTWGITEADLFAKIDAFYNVFNTNFDDSKVDVIYVPNWKSAGFSNLTDANQVHVIRRMINYISAKYIGSVIQNAIYWLTPYAPAIVYEADGVHPSSAGYNVIKTYFNGILDGSYSGVHVMVEDKDTPNMTGGHIRVFFDDGVVTARFELRSNTDVSFDVNTYGMFDTGVWIPELCLDNLIDNDYINCQLKIAPIIARDQTTVLDANFQLVLQNGEFYIRYVAAVGPQNCTIVRGAISQLNFHS